MEKAAALMVAGITAQMSLRDLVYAAGVGTLVCIGYYFLCLLLGYGARARFFCDAAGLIGGALMLRSLAAVRLYAGQVRWQQLACCVAAFWVCSLLAAPLAMRWRRRLIVPLATYAWRFLCPPLRTMCDRTMQCCRKYRPRMKKKQKSRLQNAGKVLYNSNHSDEMP